MRPPHLTGMAPPFGANLGVEGVILGVGVDRIDYTKGIVERFRGIERFLEQHPAYAERFVFVQIGAPSRTHIQRYQDLVVEVEREAGRINRRFGTGGWQPIRLLSEHHGHHDIDRLYRVADFCLVTSLHDGMNLVAKEFVAAREDEDGVLVLSQFAGAAAELTDAIIVNPYDVEQLAAAIRVAIEMPARDRRHRMQRMRRGRTRPQRVPLGSRSRVGPCRDASRRVRGGAHRVMPHDLLSRWLDVTPMLQQARAVGLFLDFDGTLAALRTRPDAALLSESTRRLLGRLARRPRIRVTIISGRRRSDLVARVNLPRVRYWGLFGWERRRGCSLPTGPRRALGELSDRLRNIAGVRLEDKTFALAVHVRHASPAARRRVRSVLQAYLKNPASALRVIRGAEAWNVLPPQIPGKGDAVSRALRQAGPAVMPIYVGDDETDEPAFAAVRRGLSVRVGGRVRTRAQDTLADPEEVGRFLERLDGVL